MYIERLLWPEPKKLKQAQFSRGADPLPGNPWLQQVLRSYCIATIKACHFVHSMVTVESYYEVCRRNVFSRANLKSDLGLAV